MPTAFATASAVARLSPVSITTLTPIVMQRANGFSGRRLDGIGHADETCGVRVDRHEHHRLPLTAKIVGTTPKRPRIDPERFKVPNVADRDAPAIDDAGDSLPGDRIELCRRRQA